MQPGPDEAELQWIHRLITLLDLLCRMVGCEEARSLGGSELSLAISRLSVSVGAGIPELSGADEQIALDAAVEASAIADQHAPELGSDYAVLDLTLNALIAAFASGSPR